MNHLGRPLLHLENVIYIRNWKVPKIAFSPSFFLSFFLEGLTRYHVNFWYYFGWQNVPFNIGKCICMIFFIFSSSIFKFGLTMYKYKNQLKLTNKVGMVVEKMMYTRIAEMTAYEKASLVTSFKQSLTS